MKTSSLEVTIYFLSPGTDLPNNHSFYTCEEFLQKELSNAIAKLEGTGCKIISHEIKAR